MGDFMQDVGDGLFKDIIETVKMRPVSPEVYLTIGPMNSGKTTWLCEKLSEAQKKDASCLVIISRKDTRINNKLVDMAKESMNTKLVRADSADIKRRYDAIRSCSNNVEVYDYAFLDECQFFDGLHEFVYTLATERVFIAGLDRDYKQDPFPTSMSLSLFAHNTTLTLSTCLRCNNYAKYSAKYKKTATADLIQIGSVGKEYLTLCKSCLNDMRKSGSIL